MPLLRDGPVAWILNLLRDYVAMRALRMFLFKDLVHGLLNVIMSGAAAAFRRIRARAAEREVRHGGSAAAGGRIRNPRAKRP